MSERKLATIQRIEEIRPIEGADAIEVARVLGWDVVVKKGEFKVGDLAIYFEIDSFLPRREEWAFLEKSCLRRMGEKEGLRLKTIKLRGQVSQGLLLPIYILHNPNNIMYPFPRNFIDQLTVGHDVTQLLGVVKWDPPLPASLSGTARGNFPTFIPKTDQERIQNCFKYLKNKWLDHYWEVSMKLDGSSMTVYYRTDPDLSEGQFGVCSRNLDLVESADNTYWRVAREYDLERKLRDLGRSLAIQGELMGPGVQGNKESLSHHKLFVFDIWDIDEQRYLTAAERYRIVEHLYLDHVPLIETDAIRFHEGITVDEILGMADGPSIEAKLREGIVFKSITDPSVSFKAISNRWLLKHDE